jgi:type II restriction enzyme
LCQQGDKERFVGASRLTQITPYLIFPDNREKEVLLQLQRQSINNSDIEIHYILFSELENNCDVICKLGEDKGILKKIYKVAN